MGTPFFETPCRTEVILNLGASVKKIFFCRMINALYIGKFSETNNYPISFENSAVLKKKAAYVHFGPFGKNAIKILDFCYIYRCHQRNTRFT